MLHGAVRRVFQAIGVITAATFIILPLLAWRLSVGPIALDFLNPTIEAALADPDGVYRMTLEGTVLAWGDGDRMIEIRALGVKAYAGSDQPVASVPEMALTLNGRALLAGRLAPGSVMLRGAKLHLVRNADGGFLVGIGEGFGPSGSEGVVAALLDALMGDPVPGQPGRHLKKAAILDAEVLVEDQALGAVWQSPDTDLVFSRTPEGILVEGAVALNLDGSIGQVSARALFGKGSDFVEGEVRFSDIRPAALAKLGGPLVHLAALDLPLSGSARGKAGLAGDVRGLTLDLAGGEGFIDLPEPAKGRHRVASLILKGSVEDGMNRAVLDELTIDIGGPTATLAAVADGLAGGADTVLKIEAGARNVGFDQLDELWPPALAPDPRQWVVKNLKTGIAREARATISMTAPGGDFSKLVIDHVSGELKGDGATVDYLAPMPPARNVAAVATFDAKAFRIALKAGELWGLKLSDGLVVLSGLDEYDQFADITLDVAGPLADALKLIDSKPLGYAKALGLDPAGIAGQASTKVNLKFPLLKTLRLDDVKVKAHATLKGASIPKVAMGLDLSGADLELDVDAKGLDAKGQVVLGGIPASLVWRENFAVKGQPFRSRYVLDAPVIDEAGRKALGLDTPPFVAPFMSGPIGALAVVTLAGAGQGVIESKLDLSPSRMELPGFNWRKEERTTGGAVVVMRLDGMKLAGIPSFQVQAGDLATSGQIAFDGNGRAKRVDFQKLSFGRTSVQGTLGLRPGGGMDVAFRGPSFDAEAAIATSDEEKQRRAEGRPRPKSTMPPMSITLDVGRLWVSAKGAVLDAQLSLARDAEEWRSLSLKGNVGERHSPLAVTMAPAGAGKRSVKVTSDDAGAMAQAFDAYADLRGGKLLIEGQIDDTKPEQPLTGTLKVANYNVVNAPVLARLLTVAALGGILDLLQGEGVSFASLEAPFTLADGLLSINDAGAYGATLGITAKGQVDLDRSKLAIEGTVVPAYALNSVLGNIPLLGWIITGGEKGGGLLAFNYSVKGPSSSPSVTVNPLSVLTPGFLRNLFHIFDDGSGTEARRKAPSSAPGPGQTTETPPP